MFNFIIEVQGGIWGAIIGGLLGLCGGVIGTYHSIKNRKSPLARSFIIKASVVFWLSSIIFLGLLFGLPFPYGFIMWVPYGVFLPLGIRYVNKRLYGLEAR
jgi:hypothetical protein